MKTTIINKANWTTLYDGYGSVNWTEKGVDFRPKKATSSGTTHAVMILQNRKRGTRDFSLNIKASTISQLRDIPNAWECFWFVFNYKKTEDGYKKANYITLKPNGVELGTMDADVGQKFLYTSGAPNLQFGKLYDFKLVKKGKELTFSIDGKVIFKKTFADLYDHAGTFGLYSEDAVCFVESVVKG